MGFPDNVLADDERVVEHLHPHLIQLAPAFFWLVVVFVGGGFGVGGLANNMDAGTTRTVLIWAVVVVGVALLVWLTLIPVVRRASTHYVFTSHRVLTREGVFTHTGRDISLQRINDVGFRQTLWERIVRSGTLTIESAGEHGQSEFDDVPRADQQQQLLNRLIEQDGERRAQLHHPPDDYGRGYR